MVVWDMEEGSTCWRGVHGGGQYMWLAYLLVQRSVQHICSLFASCCAHMFRLCLFLLSCTMLVTLVCIART